MFCQNLKIYLDLKAGGRRTPSAKRSRVGTATKRPGSAKSNFSIPEEVNKNAAMVTDKAYVFTGYSLGDNLFRVSGDQSYLFPCNGSLIKIERISYVQQNTVVQISVMQNDDVVTISFVNPRDLDVDHEMEGNTNCEITKIPSIETSNFGNYQIFYVLFQMVIGAISIIFNYLMRLYK